MPRWRNATVGRVMSGLIVLALLLVPNARVSAQLAMPIAEATRHPATAPRAAAHHHATPERHSPPCDEQKPGPTLACCFMGACMADAAALPVAPPSKRVRQLGTASYSIARVAVPDGLPSAPDLHPPDPAL